MKIKKKMKIALWNGESPFEDGNILKSSSGASDASIPPAASARTVLKIVQSPQSGAQCLGKDCVTTKLPVVWANAGKMDIGIAETPFNGWEWSKSAAIHRSLQRA